MKETINRRYSKEMLLEMQSEMIDKIQFQEQSLLTIRESKALIMEKWQNFLQVILPIQLEVINRYGFGEGQVALSLFNEAYAHQAATSRDLQELNRKKWIYLFEKAFNVSKVNDTSLEQIRQMIADIAEAMASKQFLEQIDGIAASFSEDNPLSKNVKLFSKPYFLCIYQSWNNMGLKVKLVTLMLKERLWIITMIHRLPKQLCMLSQCFFNVQN